MKKDGTGRHRDATGISYSLTSERLLASSARKHGIKKVQPNSFVDSAQSEGMITAPLPQNLGRNVGDSKTDLSEKDKYSEEISDLSESIDTLYQRNEETGVEGRRNSKHFVDRGSKND